MEIHDLAYGPHILIATMKEVPTRACGFGSSAIPAEVLLV